MVGFLLVLTIWIAGLFFFLNGDLHLIHNKFALIFLMHLWMLSTQKIYIKYYQISKLLQLLEDNVIEENVLN